MLFFISIGSPTSNAIIDERIRDLDIFVIEEIHFNNLGITSDMMISICSVFRLLKQVKLFDLSDNLIKDEGCIPLAQSIENGFYPHLEALLINSIYINYNWLFIIIYIDIGITYHGYESFMSAICNGKVPNFHTIECSGNNIGDTIYGGFEILTTSTHKVNLTHFKFNSIIIFIHLFVMLLFLWINRMQCY